MKILFLPQTSALGPASRYRVYQFLPHLQACGVEVTASPGVSEEHYRSLYLDGVKVSRQAVFRRIWSQRRKDLLAVDDFDAVFVQKGFFPGLYSGLERKFASRKPLIFDFDDAIWLPKEGGSPLLRAIHRPRAVHDLLEHATIVITGNSFLAAYARRYSHSVNVLPSAIDLSAYPPIRQSLRTDRREFNAPVIGWIGSRTTLPYLKTLQPVFEKLAIRPRVIASGDPVSLGFDVEFTLWKPGTEIGELSKIDIGISPLPDTPWEQGKCGIKVLQYMACGIPVVASPVGVHKEMIRHGVNGFLAESEEEWMEALHLLQTDASLRDRMGEAGRKLVEEDYSLEQIAPRLTYLLKTAIRQ